MKNISNRLIKPLRKGTVYISPMKKMLSYELMTDEEIILCVKKGYLADKIFDWTEYNKAQKPVEETPVVKPVVEETPVAEPVAEEPAVEETPVEESPVTEETPVKKSKRSAKKAQNDI